jgi:hypothetical protein
MSAPQRVEPGLVERCLAHEESFYATPGESTPSLIYRYTAWREQHADCVLPEPPEAPPTPGKQEGEEGD